MHAHTSEKVKAYLQHTRAFNTVCRVEQGCPISPCQFRHWWYSSFNHGSTNYLWDQRSRNRKFFWLGIRRWYRLFIWFVRKTQAILNDPSVTAGRYGLSFAPSKCKVMRTGLITLLTLSSEALNFVGKFIYLWVQKKILLMNSHPEFQNFASSLAERFVQLSRQIHAEDLHRLQVFNHYCLSRIDVWAIDKLRSWYHPVWKTITHSARTVKAARELSSHDIHALGVTVYHLSQC